MRVNFFSLSFSSEDGSSERNMINKTTKAEIPLVIFDEYPESKPSKKNQCIPLCPLVHLSLLEHQLPKITGTAQWWSKVWNSGESGGPLGTEVYFRNLGSSDFVLNHPYLQPSIWDHTAEGRCVTVWFTDLGRLNKDPRLRRRRIPQDSRKFQFKN